jgi:hypothetical protein
MIVAAEALLVVWGTALTACMLTIVWSMVRGHWFPASPVLPPRADLLISTAFGALCDAHHLTREWLSPEMDPRVDAAMVVIEVDSITDEALRQMFTIAEEAERMQTFDGLGGEEAL